MAVIIVPGFASQFAGEELLDGGHRMAYGWSLADWSATPLGTDTNSCRLKGSSDQTNQERLVSRLSNLLRQVEKQDRQLAADLKREVDALSGRRAFGLNFERHIPETVELPGRPVRRGDKVRFLPQRGEKPTGADRRLWRVSRIRRIAGGKRLADLVPHQDKQASTTSRPVEDLVVVAEFRDPVFPGLVSTGKVERGGDRPFHTIINAENFHALQVLLYTHAGRVEAIYIDPPYNSGREGLEVQQRLR